jgi:hypothetical protein
MGRQTHPRLSPEVQVAGRHRRKPFPPLCLRRCDLDHTVANRRRATVLRNKFTSRLHQTSRSCDCSVAARRAGEKILAPISVLVARSRVASLAISDAVVHRFMGATHTCQFRQLGV